MKKSTSPSKHNNINNSNSNKSSSERHRRTFFPTYQIDQISNKDSLMDSEEKPSKKYQIIFSKKKTSTDGSGTSISNNGSDRLMNSIGGGGGGESESGSGSVGGSSRSSRSSGIGGIGGIGGGFGLYENTHTEPLGSKRRRIERENDEGHKMDKDFGNFLFDNVAGEKVINMMKNMNYDFKSGLGKDGRGMMNPIQVIKGVKTATIMSDEKKKSKSSVSFGERDEPSASNLQEEQQKNESILKWKRRQRIQQQNQGEQIIYKSAQEIAMENRRKNSATLKKKASIFTEIIDMRGPDVRVIDRPDLLKSSHGNVDEQDGIYYQLQMTEDEIKLCDEKLKQEQDKLEELKQQKMMTEKDLEIQKSNIDSLETILHTISLCYDKIQNQNIQHQHSETSTLLEEVYQMFSSIKQKDSALFDQFQIGKCAAVMIAPLIIFEIEDWKPLEVPHFKQSIFKKWKHLLCNATDAGNVNITDEYVLLLEETILQKIRKAIKDDWNPRDVQPAIKLVKAWKFLLPDTLFSTLILENLVLPKLKLTMEENWDPKTELLTTYTWIHPWLPLLGKKMEYYHIFSVIRQGMQVLLAEMQPSNQEAHDVLAKWKPVFQPKKMEELLLRTIIPKLELMMKDEFKVNPSNQKLSELECLLSWTDIIPLHYIISIFENHFSKKWLRVLYLWLTSSKEPNFDQITQWYNGWKAFFPPEILECQNKRLQSLFVLAVDMINQAMDKQQVTNPENLDLASYLSSKHKITSTSTSKPSKTKMEETGMEEEEEEEVEMTFKDLVEAFAIENNIPFVMKNQSYEGRPLYDFGGVTILIHLDAIWIKDRNDKQKSWKAIDLNTLLDLVSQNKSK